MELMIVRVNFRGRWKLLDFPGDTISQVVRENSSGEINGNISERSRKLKGDFEETVGEIKFQGTSKLLSKKKTSSNDLRKLTELPKKFEGISKLFRGNFRGKSNLFSGKRS